jgi:hypothetical protein
LESWFHFFQGYIWKERCAKVAEWERELHITQKAKRIRKNKEKKSENKKKKNKTPNLKNERINKKSKEEEEWLHLTEISFKEIQNWIEQGVLAPWNKG